MQHRNALRTMLIAAAAVTAAACGGSDVTGPPPGNGGGGQPVLQTGDYRIELVFVGETPSVAMQSAFATAAARWAQVITGDIPDVNSGSSAVAGSCGQPNFPDTRNVAIDDVRIYAEVDSIDGPGRTLGQAKPCFTFQGRTVIGYMIFDRADLAGMVSNGSAADVVLHEMGHVLGIGTLWCGSLSRACPGSEADTSWIRTTDVRYTGSYGNGAWTGFGGTGGAPVENCADGVPNTCGSGTWYGHWREATFQNELMTGYISSTENPLSGLTVGALRDLGYAVNASAADDFSLPSNALFSGPAPSVKRLEEKPYRGPIIEIDRAGEVVRRIQ